MVALYGGSFAALLRGATVVLVMVVLAPSLMGTGASPPSSAVPTGPVSAVSGLSAAAHAVGVGAVPVAFYLNRSVLSLSPIFWGSTVTPRAPLLPEEGSLVRSTPTEIVVWPGAGAGDDYNPMSNTLYSSAGVVAPTTPTNLTEFIAWCRTISCSAIFQVPGEIDNASFAAADVNFTEHRLGFHPAYWEIGNEPELWKHWGRPWSEWAGSAPVTVTPTAYAWEVHNYTAAMRAVDPSIRIIGLPGTGRANGPYQLDTWVAATVGVNARNLSGIAFHVYPAGAFRHDTTLTNFYAAIDGPSSLTARILSVRSTIRNTTEAVCPSCAPIPVLVTEVGSALSHWDYSSYSVGYPGGLNLAAQTVEAMDLNLTNIDLFATVSTTSNSWFDLNGTPRPDYTIYSQILSHLGTEIRPVHLLPPDSPLYRGSNTSLAANLYGVATLDPRSGNRSDLMVVNLNLSTPVAFSPTLPRIRAGTPTEVWTWRGRPDPTDRGMEIPATAAPVAHYYPHGIPVPWNLSPQSIVEFEAYPSGGHLVEFTPFGLPNGTRWFLAVNGTLRTENDTGDLAVLLASGTYPVSAPTLPGLRSALRSVPGARYEAVLPSAVVVGPFDGPIKVAFDNQWSLRLTVAPAAAGSILPAISWTNASSPFLLQARPAPGFLLSRWIGFGPGSYNGTNGTATLDPQGPVDEKLLFQPGYWVAVTETGLPNGTPWSILVRGNLSASSTDVIRVTEPNGTFGFSVAPVAGYRSTPVRGSFTVDGGPVSVAVHFVRRTPAPPTYRVWFVEEGLPAGTAWSITMRNETVTTPGNVSAFQEPDGRFGYTARSIAGYRAQPANSAFTVNEANVTVPVLFVPVRYLVIFEATGLDSNASWSMQVGNDWIPAHGDWTTVALENGSYRFTAPNIGDYLPTPRTGTVVVAGSGPIVPIRYDRPMYGVTILLVGAVDSRPSLIRFAAQSELVSTRLAGFQIPNGTYNYDVAAPSGLVASPSHGNITVLGTPVVLRIQLLPRGGSPAPPLGTLLEPALVTVALIAGSASAVFLLVGAAQRRRRPGP